MGSIFAWFSSSQSYLNIDRIFSAPPPQVQREIDGMGQDIARQFLGHQAAQFTRRLQETWEVMQLGLGGALLATAVMTSHRSRTLIAGTILMLVIVAVLMFSVTPNINGLGRALEFQAATAALRERQSFVSYQLWFRVLEAGKSVVLILITSRLLFDFYDFGKLLPRAKRPVRRRRRSGPYGSIPRPEPAPPPGNPTD